MPWKCIQYTIHWDNTQMLKKIAPDKTNGTKNAIYFFREPQLITVLLLICDSFTSWSTRFVSLKVCVGFSIFDSVSFLLKFICLFKKINGLFDFKTSWFLSKLKDVCVSWSSPKGNRKSNFLNLENQSFENVSFSPVTFQ